MNTTKVITGKVRFSYLHVFEPHAKEEGGEKKYSVSLLISKNDTKTLENINKALDIAKESAKAKFGGKLPVKFKMPLNDGDSERPNDDAYKNCYYINANTRNKPGLVDKNLNPILDKEDLYSGCYGRASITFFPYDARGNKGVACWLNNLQKLEDGEPLGGVKNKAEADFATDFQSEEDEL